MNDTATREEKRSRLDEFAQASMPPVGNDLVTMPQQQTAVLPQVSGAQAVAIHRDERQVLQKLKALAAAAGDDWYYRFPVKNRKKGTTDWIEGPSIKLANDLARLYGNCEVDCRAQDFGNVLLFHARFVDLETGFALTRPFQQRKSAAKLGGGDDDRREDIAFQIGASKAIRNVVVNALQTFSDFAFNEAKEALVDKIGGDVERWRNRAAERISSLVSLDRVEAVVGRKVDDWLAPDIARVIAMGKAINDGMASVNDTFPPLHAEAQPDEREMVGKTLDHFATDVVDELPEPGEPSPLETPGSAPPDPDDPHAPHAQKDQAAATGGDWNAAQIIDKTLGIATVGSQGEPQRLENLDAQTAWLDQHYPDHAEFIGTLHSMAVKVAKGELAKEAAKRYLTALAK